jgi:hypothetical protein
LDRLGGYVRANVDLDRRALVVDSVVQRSLMGMLDDGDYRQAAKTAMEWDEWVADGNVPTGDDVERSDGSGTNYDVLEELVEDVY